MILDEMLANGELIIHDGAVGAEIERLGGNLSSTAWCGVANQTHPDAVREVHVQYLRAGTNIITTNTFATARHVLNSAGLGDESAAITAAGVQLAREAIEEVAPDRPVAIAGSMSNHVAWLPGSFSPDPRYAPTPDAELANYKEQACALSEAGADFLLLEMMSDLHHAARAAEAAASTGLPIWIGISCSVQPNGDVSAWDMHVEEPPENLHPDHKPSTGYLHLARVIETMLSFEPQVVGIMHSGAVSIEPGLDEVRRQWPGPLLAYPEATNHHALSPQQFAEHCRDWVDNGVQVIGGCCGTTIHHIRAMIEAMPERANA